MLAQIGSVTLINLRSIPQRWGMSLATIFSIAIVVVVLLGFLSMANGFRATIDGSGSEDIAIMLRSGSQAELNSGFGRDMGMHALEGYTTIKSVWVNMAR